MPRRTHARAQPPLAALTPPVALLLVLELLLQAGKIHFGYIYGFGAFGNVAIYTIMNLMATTGVSGGHTS